MKIALKLVVVIAMLAIAISCLKVENTPQFPKSLTSFSVTPSTTSVSVTAKDSLSNAVTFTWTDPKYATGLTNSKFTVMVGVTGKNFASFSSKSFSGVLTGALLGKDINGMALKLGGVIGQSMSLDVKVVASQANNDEPINSNVVQITFSPYGDLGLSATSLTKTLSAANASNPADTLSWNVAFNGYSGVKTYVLQSAKGGSAFASPNSVSVTTFSKVYSQLDLNKAALGFGAAPGVAFPIDFRLQATDELGTSVYSNVVTLTVTPYVANNSIDVIGDATPGSWSTGTEMYRPDPVNNPGNWVAIVNLIGGKSVKFRADQQWNTNWGSSAWPTGTGTQNGNNIPVGGTSGYYQITLNSGTGAYSFTPVTVGSYTSISVIGDAAGGWGVDSLLTQSATDPNVWSGNVTLSAGGHQFKFRANQAWTVSWGSATLSPTGYSGWATSNNGANITVPVAGKYFCYINVATGEFFFGNLDNNPGASAPYGQIGLVGDVVGSWSNDKFMVQNPQNPFEWSLKICDNTGAPVQLPAAAGKIRANAAWTTSWGGSTFPNGVGTTKNDPNISVLAGTPQIIFNSATGEYSFVY